MLLFSPSESCLIIKSMWPHLALPSSSFTILKMKYPKLKKIESERGIMSDSCFIRANQCLYCMSFNISV